MRISLTSRIFSLLFVYFVVFFALVSLQFSNKGNFSLSTGAMTIKGRYLQSPPQASLQAAERNYESGGREITGGIKIFYSGIEFSLVENKANGLILTGNDGVLSPVNPDFMILEENKARFGLPGGTMLVFSLLDSSRGPELQISAEFAENISEAAVPVVPRRSSLIRDNGQLGILYNGDRYFFGSSSYEFENSKLVLSKEAAVASYRSRVKENAFDPADYIIAQSNNYENALISWQDSSYTYWSRNASILQNENEITAYCGEALRHGNYTAAVASISRDFLNSPRHSYKSASFLGGMTAAYRVFANEEREKINQITLLTREKSLDVLKEDHILDFLLTRNNNALANDIIEIINSVSPEQITPGYCPGLLEAYSDLKRWRPPANNHVESLIDQILFLVSENIHRDNEKDLVFVSPSAGMDIVNSQEFSLRLGKALLYWAEDVNNTEWTAIGRSLVLSALTNGGVGSGSLYSIMDPGDYFPRAAWLADNGLWAWSVSPSVMASYIEGNLNIAITFPRNMAHYVIIRGVRPFIKIQIHDMDWRTDSQFERYDSSGWIYYSQDQILVLKLRHRATVENVRVFYRAEEPPPPPPPVIEERANTEEEPLLY